MIKYSSLDSLQITSIETEPRPCSQSYWIVFVFLSDGLSIPSNKKASPEYFITKSLFEILQTTNLFVINFQSGLCSCVCLKQSTIESHFDKIHHSDQIISVHSRDSQRFRVWDPQESGVWNLFSCSCVLYRLCPGWSSDYQQSAGEECGGISLIVTIVSLYYSH